jgi:hypothetical protein
MKKDDDFLSSRCDEHWEVVFDGFVDLHTVPSPDSLDT